MQSVAVTRKTCPRCKRVFDSDAAFCPNDGAPLEPSEVEGSGPEIDPYIGTVIQGDIEIRSVAGVGAMGRVYRAYQRGIDRDVAVKILHSELSGNQPLVQRFHREAKIASKLQHPHVVEVYFTGQLPDGALYIVMEYLDGLSLAAALEAAGKSLPIDRALRIALQICDAVGEGHARGIIHRDLKPENVMLIRRADTSDWVKVLDFGIAKVSIGEQSMETAAGLIFGTARYISPEGAQGAIVGPPGDVYSIAVILYQLLAGHTPFDAAQPVGLLVKHIYDAPPPIRSAPAAANLPEPIARVIMDNLAKEPGQRAPNARALGTALAHAAKEANVAVSDVGVFARMSIVDASVAPRRLVEPTLDDAAAQPAPVVTAPIGAPAVVIALADTAAGEKGLRDSKHAEPAPSTRRGSAARRSTALIITLAFLLGAAITGLVMQYTSNRTDAARSAQLTRARKALVKGHYVEPAGDNVRELVTSGLGRWPDDPSFIRIQSDAAHELATHAMAERAGGDVAGARDLAKTAHDVDPTDSAATLLLSQYEAELATLMADGGNAPGPRVMLTLPSGQHHPGQPIELDARVMTGPNRHKVAGALFLVTGPGLPPAGMTLPIGGSYRVAFTPPAEGDYAIHFEANVEGVSVRANRTLTVVR